LKIRRLIIGSLNSSLSSDNKGLLLFLAFIAPFPYHVIGYFNYAHVRNPEFAGGDSG